LAVRLVLGSSNFPTDSCKFQMGWYRTYFNYHRWHGN